MTNSSFKFAILFFFFSLVVSSCVSHCMICNEDEMTCKICNRGFKLNQHNDCSLPNSSLIIAISIISGSLILTIGVVTLCICLKGWKKVINSTQIQEEISNEQIQKNMISNKKQTRSNIDDKTQNILHLTFFQNITNSNPLFIHGQPKLNMMKTAKVNINEICTICNNTSCNVITIPCCHQFHYGCLALWFNLSPTCPKCDKNITKVKLQCNICGSCRQYVSFCPPGCTNSDHKQCFQFLNSCRLVCKKCQKFSKSSRLLLTKTTFNKIEELDIEHKNRPKSMTVQNICTNNQLFDIKNKIISTLR